VGKPVARDRIAFAVLRNRMAHRSETSILVCLFVAAIPIQHFTEGYEKIWGLLVFRLRKYADVEDIR
jgi:hypothetical protein